VNYYSDEIDFYHSCFSQLIITESLSNAVHKRQAEYVVGRYCAQQALILMGNKDYSVGRYSDQSPKWPPSLIGSITHTHCFSMAAVASNRDYIGIGIDTEVITTSIQIGTFADQFISASELNLGISKFTKEIWLYIAFSAKESIYKSLYPKIRKFFGFFDVEIISVNKVDSKQGSLIARLINPLGCFKEGFLMKCSYLIDIPYIHTQVLL
jgi:enterobactin synthetase component D